MKRIIVINIILIVVLLISCNNEMSQDPNSNADANANEIYPRALTPSEEELLSLIGFNDSIEIYDFETDGSFKSISLWLEVYKEGALVENRGKMHSSFDGENGSIAVKVTKNERYD